MSNTYTVRKYYPDGSSEPVREEIVLHDFNRPASPAPQSNGNASLGTATTDDLPEGKKNLYYNQERVKSLVLSLLNKQDNSSGQPHGTTQGDHRPKASQEDLDALQVAVSKMQQAVSSVLSKSTGSVADFNDAVLELKKELSSKVSSSEFIKLLANRVTIQDLEDALKPYATTSRVNLLSERVGKQELRLKALESADDAHSTASLLELINQRVSKDELKESLAAYSALLGNIQNGLSGYATASYVRTEIERTRVDPSRFATPADVEALGKAFEAKLKDNSKALTSALSVDTAHLVTDELFNLRMSQEVAKFNEKIEDMATKQQVAAILPLLSPASHSQHGLMSATDKEKLDNIPAPRTLALKDDLIAVSKRVSVLESSGIDTSKLVTKTDLNLLAEELRVSNKKTNLSAYALSSDVNGKYAQIADRLSVLEAKADKPVDLSSLVTVQTFNALANKVNAISIPTLPDFTSFAPLIRVEELDSSVASLKRDVETNYLGKQAFRTEFEVLQDVMSHQVKGLSARIDRLNTAIRMLPSGDIKVDNAAVTDEQLEGKLAPIRTELKSIATNLETKSSALQQADQSVYRRLDAATAATVALEQRVSEIALANAEQNGRIDLLKASIAKLPDTGLVSEVARRVSSVEARVDSIRVPSIEALETQVGVHSAELLTVRNQVREIQTVIPTEAKPTKDTLVSHGAMKTYVSSALADSLTPTATRAAEGLVRLATQAEVHSRTGSSVPTVSDVATLLTNIPTASNRVNGLMTPAMITSLEKAATKAELADESSKLNDTFTSRITQQNKRIDAIGREQSLLRVKVATLEGAAGIDPTVFATKSEYTALKEEVERVSKFDRLTHDDLDDAKTLLTKGYEGKVKELDDRLTEEIAKVAKAAPKPDSQTATSVDTSNLATKRELRLLEAEIRADIPKFKAGDLVTNTLFSDTLLTKVNPLVEKVALLQKDLATRVSTTEFNDYKESVSAANGGSSAVLFAKRSDLDAVKKTVDKMGALLGDGRGLENLSTVESVEAKLTTCKKESRDYTDSKATEVGNRIEALETRMAAVDGDRSDALVSKMAKAVDLNAVKEDLASYKESNTKELNGVKELVSPVSGKVSTLVSDFEDFKAKVSEKYLPMSDTVSFATKEELRGYAKKSDVSMVSDRVSIVSESLASFREVVAVGYIPNAQKASFATKEELSAYATKEELKAVAAPSTDGFATKEELKGYATKADLAKIPASQSTEGLATKEELKGYLKTGTLASLATKEELSAIPRPAVVKAQLTDGTPYTLDMSQYVGKVVRLTAVLANATNSAITLTKAALTLGEQEVAVENKEVGADRHLVFEPKVLVPYTDAAYSVLVTGANASITIITEVLA